MSSTYKDLFKVSLKYYDYLVHKSLFVHQFVKNISASGDMVEEDFRNLLSNILPDRFRVTHGYIVYCDSMENEPVVSPQVDIIIVDNLVPNVLFLVDDKKGTEIVPKEAVVGIIEVKRTLNKDSYKQALDHIYKIVNKVNIVKNSESRFLPGGIPLGEGFEGGLLRNPLIGIIALQCEKEDFKKENGKLIIERYKKNVPIDLTFSFDGFAIYTAVKVDGRLRIYPVDFWDFKTKTFEVVTVFDGENGWNREGIVGSMLGFLMGYLEKRSGEHFDVNKYFFNHVLYDVLENREEE